MATGIITNYTLTSGVIVNIDPLIYLLDPLDAPMITGQGLEGGPLVPGDTTDQVKFEWQDDNVLLPRSTLAASVTTGTAFITVATGHQQRFGTGDELIIESEYLKVTGYGTTTDTLLVDRAFSGTAVNHNTSIIVLNLGSAVAEGSDPATGRALDRTRNYNLTQVFIEPEIKLSGTAQVVARYGVPNEWAHQIMRMTQVNAIKRDQSFLYGARTESTTTTVRSTGGLKYYVTTNTDASSTTLTPTVIQTAMQTCWDAGGRPDTLIVNPKAMLTALDIANTTTMRLERQDNGRGRPPVTYFNTEFGTVQPVRNRNVRFTASVAGDWFLLPRINVKRRVLREMSFQLLAQTGDYQKGMIVCEEGYEIKGEEHMLAGSALTG